MTKGITKIFGLLFSISILYGCGLLSDLSDPSNVLPDGTMTEPELQYAKLIVTPSYGGYEIFPDGQVAHVEIFSGSTTDPDALLSETSYDNPLAGFAHHEELRSLFGEPVSDTSVELTVRVWFDLNRDDSEDPYDPIAVTTVTITTGDLRTEYDPQGNVLGVYDLYFEVNGQGGLGSDAAPVPLSAGQFLDYVFYATSVFQFTAPASGKYAIATRQIGSLQIQEGEEKNVAASTRVRVAQTMALAKGEKVTLRAEPFNPYSANNATIAILPLPDQTDQATVLVSRDAFSTGTVEHFAVSATSVNQLVDGSRYIDRLTLKRPKQGDELNNPSLSFAGYTYPGQTEHPVRPAQPSDVQYISHGGQVFDSLPEACALYVGNSKTIAGSYPYSDAEFIFSWCTMYSSGIEFDVLAYVAR